MLLGEASHACGEVQHVEVRHILRDDAESERDVAALPEGVDAEARQILLLVGDIEVTGGLEGFEALVTARLAAEHIVGDELEAYEAAVRVRLDPLSSAGWGAKKALDRFPRAVFAIMRLPVTWRVLEKLMLGEVAHPGEARGAGRTAMKLIEGLARAA